MFSLSVLRLSVVRSSVHWKIWLFCACFLPLTLNLGFWQLDRTQEKVVLEEALNKARELPAIALTGKSQVEAEPIRAFSITGHFEPQVLFLDNRTRSGRAGYEVLQRFATDTGLNLLVNRGWVPAPKYRSELPNIDWPESKLSIEGYVYRRVSEIPVLGPTDQQVEGTIATASQLQKKEGKFSRVQTLNWALLAQDPRQIVGEFRPRVEQADWAYELGWSESGMGADKHRGYAFQWFALSLTLVLLCCFASYTLARRNSSVQTPAIENSSR